MTYRLGILTTHPIQYQAPWFRRLAAHPELDVTVLFAFVPTEAQQGADFGVNFAWDIPLLEGYAYDVLDNLAANPNTSSYSGCDTPAVGARIEAGRFDAFLICGWHVRSHFQALRACRKLGIPTLVRGDSNVLMPRPWWKRLRHRWILSRFAACLYVGKANRSLYLRGGVSEDRLFPARHFVDNERFAKQSAAARERRESLRRQWGIGPDEIVPLFCAKFIEKKHPMDFLHAMKRVGRNAPPVHALLVGEGKLKESCERYARRNGIPASFAGFLNQSELPAAYAASDCLVLPSDYGETWGLVVNEAMACGLPAIVSDQVGCGPDLVTEGETGLTFPCGDVDALADCIRRMAANPAAMRRMGDAARRRIADYSIDAAVEGTLAAVRWLCDAGEEERRR